MATVKLNTDLRGRILVRLLRHRFQAEADALVVQFRKLADDVYLDAFKEDLKILLAARDGLLVSRSHIGVKFGVGYHYEDLVFNGDFTNGELRCLNEKSPEYVYRTVPADKIGCAANYSEDNPLTERYYTLNAERDRLLAAKKSAERQIKLALEKATTVAKLAEIWPEVRPFVQDFLDEPPAPLPAIPVETLNKALDLPVKRAA